MPTWRHTLAVARRRSAAKVCVSAATGVLPYAAGAALAWVAVAAALETAIHWPIVVSCVILCTAAAAVVGFVRRPSKLAVATTLDRHAGNHSAISTALQLSAKRVPTPLEARAIADADNAAGAANPGAAFPWSLRRPALLTVLAAVMLTGAAFIPARWTARAAQFAGLSSSGGAPKVEVQKALADAQAAEQLIKAVQPPATASQPTTSDANTQRSDNTLTDLQKQLERGQITPKEATQQAATAVERAADRLDRRAADAQTASDLLRDRLAMGQKDKHDAGKPSSDSPSELSRALRDGDLEKAASEAERLADAAEKLSPADRAKLAEDLQKLADDLKTPPPPKSAPESKPDAVKPPLPDKADSADRPRAPTNPPKPESPAKPESADKPSPQSDADKNARDLADKLDRAAEELNKPKPPASDKWNQPDKPNHPDKSDKPSNSDKPQSPDKSDSPQSSPDTQPSPDRPSKSNDKPQPADKPQPDSAKPSSDGKPQPSDQSGQSKPLPQSQPGQPSRDDQPKPDGQAQPGTKEQPGGQQQPADKPSSQGTPTPETSRPTPGGQPGEKPRPGGRQPTPNPNPSPDGKPQPGDQPSDKPPALDQLRDQLKKLADQPREAQQDRQDAQKLREQAQKMWENATPEQRKEMQRLARELAQQHSGAKDPTKRQDQRQPGAGGDPHNQDDPSKDSGLTDGTPPSDPESRGKGGGDQPRGEKPLASDTAKPGTTHDIDARSKGNDAAQAPSRVIAEWLTNKPAPRTGDAPAAPPADVARALDQSRQNAEQAVQQRTVPARLTPLIRRYFDRLPQAVGASPAPALPAAPSQPPAPTPPPATPKP